MVVTYPVLSLLIIFALLFLIIRIGSIALRMTGLSPDVASFQAASAFTGTGFTTQEAEKTISTPERRAIVLDLFLMGGIGLVSAISSLVLSFLSVDNGDSRSLGYIIGGVVAIVFVAKSDRLNRLLTPPIERVLSRTTDLDLCDYTQILGFQNDYRIAEIRVEEGEWLATAELNLAAEGVLSLGIRQADGTYIGAPTPDTEIRPEDTLVLYGREHRLRELSDREAWNIRAHENAVEEHDRLQEE